MSDNKDLQKLINEGEKLRQLDMSSYILSEILIDLKGSDYFKKSFLRYFFIFIGAFSTIDEAIGIQDLKRLEMLSEMSLSTIKSPLQLVTTLTSFQRAKNEDDYFALFQNAYIYAIACCYKSQISSTYMKAKKNSILTEKQQSEYMIINGQIMGNNFPVHEAVKAKFSDVDYANYTKEAHPLLTSYIKSKHRFENKKMLVVIGYLINPELT